MDTDDVMLDWGAHDDDDAAQLHSQDPSGIVGRESIVAKDEATLSGAESLLALASGGVDAQDDKDSDVVSLGGGEDDMEELYAYQSRTHLGGIVSGDTALDEPVLSQSTPKEGSNSEARKPARTLSASTPSTVPKTPQNLSNDPVSDTSRSPAKLSSQLKPPATENARSPSTTRHALPAGPLGLPPKPVAAPTTPYIRPSHPSIMSASSMAAPTRERDRDLQRDHHDGMKSKHASHSHASPDRDVLPLAPGWETRRARDGTQDMYYYNTKTQQSTWSRSLASNISSSKLEESASPLYSRGRVKEQFHSSGLESPVAPDITRPAGHDSGTQPRTRPTRFDPIRIDPAGPTNAPTLTFEERHYRPNESRSPERSTPPGDGDLRLQHQARGTSGPVLMHHDQSPANHPTHPPLRRGDDRDFQVVNRVRSRDRDERGLPPYGDRAPGRNGERRNDSSHSPGRGRSRNVWPNELVSNPWVRDGAVSPSIERRASVVLEGPRPSYGGSSLPYRGPPQVARSGSLGREDRTRYAPPINHDQSSSRDRHRSPLPERPHKRTRSESPVFDNASQRQAFRPPQSQPFRPWNDFNPNEARHRDHTTRPDNQTRDRPPHQHPEPPSLLTSKPYADRLRNGSSDRDRIGQNEYDRENDAKRQKFFDISDSTETHRPHTDIYIDPDTRREEAPRRKRQPLPPQSERFKEMAPGPPGPPPPPPPRHPPNGPHPSAAPSGPRRLPNRESTASDSTQQGRVRSIIQNKDFEDTRVQIGHNSRAKPFDMTNNFSEGKHYDERGRARQWEREKDKSLSAELPTGPRAMDLDAEPPMFSRRGRSPPLERTGRSPPSHFPINGPRKSDRRDHLAPSELRFSTNAPDRSQRERDYQSGRRVGESQEFGRPRPFGPDSLPFKPRFQQQVNRPVFGSNHPDPSQLPIPTRKSDEEQVITKEPLPIRDEVARQRTEAKGDVEPQLSGPSGSSGMDLDHTRTSLDIVRPSSPPSGARAVRIRRPSKQSDATAIIEHKGPAGRGQPQTNRLPRQGSLLDRLSNPSTPGMTPPLRDRVGSPGETWKRGGTGSQLGPGTSLRDRLEDIGDVRHARNPEWDQSFEDGNLGSNRRDRQNTRRDRPRRGGRGQ